MRGTVTSLTLAVLAVPVAAQVFPTPGLDSPRIQSVAWQPSATIVLTALPETTLTVMLEPGETITRATLSGDRAWDVSVAAETDSFQVTPQAAAQKASLFVETDRRSYEFLLETAQSLQSAYVVRLTFDAPRLGAGQSEAENQTFEGLDWSYRLRGDRSVRPASIRDNGEKTVIEYGVGQSLPAVFAIGPSGDEEVVDGYMRGGKFIIDRVHSELVFRIDKEKATARRNKERDEAL